MFSAEQACFVLLVVCLLPGIECIACATKENDRHRCYGGDLCCATEDIECTATQTNSGSGGRISRQRQKTMPQCCISCSSS